VRALTVKFEAGFVMGGIDHLVLTGYLFFVFLCGHAEVHPDLNSVSFCLSTRITAKSDPMHIQML